MPSNFSEGAYSDTESERERKLSELLRKLRFSSRGDLVIPLRAFNTSRTTISQQEPEEGTVNSSTSDHVAASSNEDLLPPSPAPRRSRGIASTGAASSLSGTCYCCVIFGATGRLAREMIYPALWSLFVSGDLPNNLYIVGLAFPELSVYQLRQICRPYMQVGDFEVEREAQFWKRCYYVSSNCASPSSLQTVTNIVTELEYGFRICNRIFYLAIPLTAYYTATRAIHSQCIANQRGWNRIIVERCGTDGAGSLHLSNHLLSLFGQDMIFRIDHFLDSSLLASLLMLRFGNSLLSSTWNKSAVASVLISFKDTQVQKTCNDAESHGVISDVLQGHTLQVFSLIAMEKPISSSTRDIWEEKIRVLRATRQVETDHVVLGQQVDGSGSDTESMNGSIYKLPSVTKAPTFACVVLNVDNDRWAGVPFILRCGRGLDEARDEVRVQYRDTLGSEKLFPGVSLERNELVITLHPKESVGVKLQLATMLCGSEEAQSTHLTMLSQPSRYFSYDHQLLSLFGEGANLGANSFHEDEVRESWRIFTPLLNDINRGKIKLFPYFQGSGGPQQATTLCQNNNFL